MNQHPVQVGALTDTGKRRPVNQDSYFADQGIYVVCDGMGGESGGERASAIAVEEFAQLASCTHRSRNSIEDAIQNAQTRALALGAELGGIAGTTVTGVIFPDWHRDVSNESHGRHARSLDSEQCVAEDQLDMPSEDWDSTQPAHHEQGESSSENRTAWQAACTSLMPNPEPTCYIVNIGDSRTYHMDPLPQPDAYVEPLWDAHSLQQITRDHSQRQEAIDSGQLSEREANQLIARNVITRCVGSPAGAHPDIFIADMTGRFIICSDGCHGEVSDATIASVASHHSSAQAAAQALVNAALEAGGSDNVTVIVVDIPTQGLPQAVWSSRRLEINEDLGDIDDVTVQT